MQVIYENKRPRFAIAKDRYQWIICNTKRTDGQWDAFSYFPNLSNLFDALAEDMFKNYTTKIKEIKELDKSIDKVYGLIDKVSGRLEAIFKK